MPVTVTIASLGHTRALEVSDELDSYYGETLAVSVNETDETAGFWNVVVYAAAAADASALYHYLLEEGFQREQLEIGNVPDVDWVRNSLEGLPPVIVGRFFLYGAHDRDKRRSGGISLEIGAGTAFGTGHHGTTTGCMSALDSILKYRRPRRILDVGCGTGILAIAAAKTLRHSTVASDIDPEALEVTRFNARLNHAAPLVTAVCAAGLKSPAITRKAPYDLIFANILARPLLALAQGLSVCLAANGNLILSGITLDQVRMVRAAYRNRRLLPLRTIQVGNWATLVFRKPARAIRKI